MTTVVFRKQHIWPIYLFTGESDTFKIETKVEFGTCWCAASGLTTRQTGASPPALKQDIEIERNYLPNGSKIDPFFGESWNH